MPIGRKNNQPVLEPRELTKEVLLRHVSESRTQMNDYNHLVRDSVTLEDQTKGQHQFH